MRLLNIPNRHRRLIGRLVISWTSRTLREVASAAVGGRGRPSLLPDRTAGAVLPPCATNTRGASRQCSCPCSPSACLDLACYWTKHARERETRTPGHDVVQRAGNRVVVWLDLVRSPIGQPVPPSSLEGSGQGGLVKQRSLTCWQSEPQRLVKRRCHGPCSPSAEEGGPCRLLIGLRSNGSHPPV